MGKWKNVIFWEPRCVALTKIQAKIKNARRRALQSVDSRNSSSSSSDSDSDRDSDSDNKHSYDDNNASSVQKWLRLENWMLVANEEEEERLKQHEKRVLAYTNLGDGKVDTPDYQSYYETKYDKNQELETFPKRAVKIPPILRDAKEEEEEYAPPRLSTCEKNFGASTKELDISWSLRMSWLVYILTKPPKASSTPLSN